MGGGRKRTKMMFIGLLLSLPRVNIWVAAAAEEGGRKIRLVVVPSSRGERERK